MSTATIAVIAENTALIVALVIGGRLLRQGGGLQVKTPPVPKAPVQPKREPVAGKQDDAGQAGPPVLTEAKGREAA